ncbi:sulfite exporter TauE/SafE family protein [Reyranella sp.]|uniref:sulfite exporter TauE/SafE family protein n=1 Tax=Reyranella sp. TaxID=1929291 RepID=UPI0011FC8545|nr:sulfite exporter TauE/SafE family protein [Reyranella sp.]TAJ86571.1 MAG: sulfite exporter TauE/SafE family protein [Reyranella sp.]
MTIAMAASLGLLMVFTAFLSGIFGMAGGMVLIGVLLFLLPLPMAMVLHAVTQMASNGWRAILWWRHIQWRITVFYVLGCFIAVGAWSLTLYVPEKAVALLMLGCSPFVLRIVPERLLPATLGPLQAMGGGIACMALMLLTGVTGPLIDQLFLRSQMNRRQIVATKASCQVFGHGSKLLYFGALIEQAGSVEPWVLVIAVAASMIGTSLGKQILERLSDGQFRMWAGRLITVLGLYYVGYGLVLLTGVA